MKYDLEPIIELCLDSALKRIEKCRPSESDYFFVDGTLQLYNPEKFSKIREFLDRYNKGRWLKKLFNGKIEIIPFNNGKKIISKEE